MLRLLDGPAKGGYRVRSKRAPLFLRAVTVSRGGLVWERDVLNVWNDAPRHNEIVHVYKLQADPAVVQFHDGGAPGNIAEYRHLPDVDGAALRDRAAWRQWVLAQ